MKKLKDSDLQTVLSEVTAEIDNLLKTERENLMKAHPGEEVSSEVQPDESATSDSAPDAPGKEESAPPAPSAPEAEATPEAPPADAPPAPPADAPADPAADPAADQGAINPEELKAEYAKLPVEDLKLHYLAAKEALFAAMGAGGEDGSEQAAPPPPAPAPGPDASASAPPALKNELPTEENGGDPLRVKKSEEAVSELQKKIDEQNLVIEQLVKAVTVVVEAPLRKSVTSIADLKKSGPDHSKLSKQEVNARLRQAAEKPLSKSDRELINSYALGHISVEKVAHLLGDK